MPYLLSPLISLDSPGMWFEGMAYEKKSIYSIQPGKLPPVNYDEHIIRPHSLTHIETPGHTQKDGRRLDFYFTNNLKHFYGPTAVIKLRGDNFKPVGNKVFHWEITLAEIKERLTSLKIKFLPAKILVSIENCPLNANGYHDPNYVLTLSQEAADFLVSHSQFDLFGISWKSSDFNPGQKGRPIHDTLFKRALILENLVLNNVPEGIYFMSAFPLPLMEASESPVVPVLFTKEEIINF